MQQLFSSLLWNEERDHLSTAGGAGCSKIILPSHQEAATCSEEISAIMGHLQNLPWMSAVRWLLSINVFISLTDCSLQHWVCEEKTVGLLHYFITLTLMKLYKHIIIEGVAQIKWKQPNIALDSWADLYILRQLPKLWLFSSYFPTQRNKICAKRVKIPLMYTHM